MEIKTAVFKKVIAKAMKCASCNKMIPLTSLISLEYDHSKHILTTITTDARNYLYNRLECDLGENNFYAVVQVDILSKLMSKLTCHNMDIEVTDKYLNIKAGGSYKLELCLDDNGNCIRYKNPLVEYISAKDEKLPELLKASDFVNIIHSNKSSLSVTYEKPYYTGYYISDKIVTTDEYKVCVNDTQLFDKFDTPILLSADTMNLIGAVFDDFETDICFYSFDNFIILETPTQTLFTKQLDNIENYDIKSIYSLVDSKYPNMCRVDRNQLITAIDRLSIFIDKYDYNCITLSFTNTELKISSKSANAIEVLEVKDGSDDRTDFSCDIDAEIFLSQLKSQFGDFAEIQYGAESTITMVDGEVTQVIGLTV